MTGYLESTQDRYFESKISSFCPSIYIMWCSAQYLSRFEEGKKNDETHVNSNREIKFFDRLKKSAHWILMVAEQIYIDWPGNFLAFLRSFAFSK